MEDREKLFPNVPNRDEIMNLENCHLATSSVITDLSQKSQMDAETGILSLDKETLSKCLPKTH